MEGLGVILFLVAIIASIFDQRKPKGQGPPPAPPRRRPQVQLPQQPRPQQSRPRPVPSQQQVPRQAPPQGSREGSAAEMLPEDFWAELTGRARPAPPPEELPPQDLPSWDEEAVARVEEESRERNVQEPRALDAYRRPEVVREVPRVVSLETPLQAPEKRHAAFHRRIDAREAAEALAAPAPAPHRLRARLRDPATLRESFVLQEVFGRPKGLEE